MKKVSFKTRNVIDIAVVIILLLSVCWLFRDFMFFSIKYVEPDISTKELAKEKLKELSNMMGIRFPKSTILLNIAEDRCKDIILFFKITAYPDELEGLLKSHPFNKVRWESSGNNHTEHYFTTQSDLGWWKVDKVQHWKTGDVELPQDAQSCRVLIDYDRQDIAIVYFVYFVT